MSTTILLAIIIVPSCIIIGLAFFLLRRKSTLTLTNDEYNLLARKKFDRFELKSFLMRGDFNSTYEALDPEREKTVALRVLNRNLLYTESVAQQFHFKGEMLKFLSDRFPGDRFIQNINFGKARVDDEIRPYIVSDYIPGVSLDTILEHFPRLSPKDTLAIIRQVGEAIALAHTQRIWIRELAPSNVILRLGDTGNLIVSLANVGVPFKSLPSESSAESKKPYYSPEDRNGDLVDSRSDVYALAALTYRILEGTDALKREKDAPWTGVSAILESSLATDISKRTFSADGFVKTLNVLEALPSTVKEIPWQREITKILKKRQSVKIKKSGAEVLPAGSSSRPAFGRSSGSKMGGKIPASVATGFFSAVFYSLFGQINQLFFSSQRKAVMAIVVAIIGLPVALWFFVFQGPSTTIKVITDPEGAIVTVSGKAYSGGNKIAVSPGYVSINVKQDGFIPVDTSLTVAEKDNLELPITLRPGATVSLSINPPDALVIIDKDTLSQMQFATYTTSIGPHLIKVSKNGYEPQSGQIILKQGSQNKLQYTLAVSNKPPRLVVTSTLPGAIVFIDDQLIGPAPYKSMEIAPGPHRVKIVSEGYQDFTRNVTVQDGKTETVEAALVTVGTISVVSKPAGANVTIDGTELGVSPKEKVQLTVGTHKLRIRKDGFKSFDTTIVIQQNQLVSIDKELAAFTGTLEIRVKPFGDIFIDNEMVKHAESHAPNSLTVTAGRRVLKVTHPTFGRWEGPITIPQGETLPLMIDFDVFYTVSVTSVDEAGQTVAGKIFVDDKDTEKYTPNSLKLRTGMHSIDIRKDNFLNTDGAKAVNLDKDQQLRFKLKKK